MSRWFARLWPLALLVGAAALMIQSAHTDPYDPALTGTARYGHDHDGALAQLLPLCLVEFAVLQLVLVPGDPQRRIGRAVVALVLLVPWTLGSLVLTMHQGGVVAAHALWLLAASAGVFVTLVARIVRRGAGG